MDKIIAAIKKRVEECKAMGIEFKMPAVEGCIVKKFDGHAPKHSTYVLELSDGRTIRVDTRSKDDSHSFRYALETSFISVECSDHSNDFMVSWEEKV